MTAAKPCTIPKLSKEFAEEIGIHIGDGHMRFKKYAWGTGYRYSISGDSREKEYLLDFVSPLIKKLYGLEPNIYFAKNKNEISIRYSNKKMVLFKYNFGLPNGKKTNIEIPNMIFNSDFVLDCIRGLFGTDGGIYFCDRNKVAKAYPRLDITSVSKPLIKQVSSILSNLDITYSIYNYSGLHYKTNSYCESKRIFIYGKRNLDKWVESIGFSNPKNIKKYQTWLKS